MSETDPNHVGWIKDQLPDSDLTVLMRLAEGASPGLDAFGIGGNSSGQARPNRTGQTEDSNGLPPSTLRALARNAEPPRTQDPNGDG